MIRAVKLSDAEDIARIYNYYIENTVITFEEKAVTTEEITRRIQHYTSSYPWLVYEEHDKILGYCYACQWRERSAYRFSAETTVYVQENQHSKGIGTALYTHLIHELKKTSIHTLVAGITLPNEKSEKLHEKIGFKKVAHLIEIGKKFDAWLDVGYWQLHLENKK